MFNSPETLVVAYFAAKTESLDPAKHQRFWTNAPRGLTVHAVAAFISAMSVHSTEVIEPALRQYIDVIAAF